MSRRIAFHECLMRIRRADGTLVAASEVVPIAERLGLVRLLDHRVLELLVTEMSAVPQLHASVNVSPASTTDPDWWSALGALLRANAGVAERLTVEITEIGGDPGHRRHPRLRIPREGSRLPHRDRRFRLRLHVVPQSAQARRRYPEDRRRLRAEPDASRRRPRLRAGAGRSGQAARTEDRRRMGAGRGRRRSCSRNGAAIICKAR